MQFNKNRWAILIVLQCAGSGTGWVVMLLDNIIR